MKTNIHNRFGINHKLFSVMLGLCLTISFAPVLAQDEGEDADAPTEKTKPKPARDAFESGEWFDGRSGKVYNKGTLEMVMNHRFGLVNGNNNDLFGIFGAAANIRIGFSYAPINRLNIGFGYTKNSYSLDLNAKYLLLQQTRGNEMPLSLTYFGNMGIETKTEDQQVYLNSTDRFSFFNQLILMRRFSSKFSAQIGPSYTHFNAVYWEQQDDGEYKSQENDTFSLNAGVRYKITSTFVIMAGYDQPITQHDINQPLPSINFGVEFVTSSHAFQIFATNYNGINPQYNYMYNQNDFGNGDFLIGFNITRLWSF